MRKSLPTAAPTIANDSWVQISTIPGRGSSGTQSREGIYVRNEDTAENYRVEASEGEPTGLGRQLRPGEIFFEEGDSVTVGHIWAKQTSGISKNTLAITEHRNA